MSPAAQQTPRQDANPIHDYYERIFEILPWAAFACDGAQAAICSHFTDETFVAVPR